MLLRETTRRYRQRTRPVSTQFAWQVHGAQEAWIGRADLKASILLALQGGALLAVLTSGDLIRRAPASWPVVVARAGAAVLLAAMILSAAAMMPALGSRRRLKAEHRSQLVYFGHLRHWDSRELGPRLAGVNRTDEAAMLAHQIVNLSRLNWRKHRLLQLSVALTLVVLVALVAAGIGVIGA